MASLYGVVTVANLEAFSGRDYSAISATLTDGIIESMAISPAEVVTKAITGKDPSSSSSNDVKYAVMMMATRTLWNWCIESGIQMTPLAMTPTQETNLIESLLSLETQTNSNKRTLWVENP